jgi:hypothetical protein
MIIDNTFFRSLSKQLLSALIQGLAFSDPQMAATYLIEDRSVIVQREGLLVRQKRLENSRLELFKFGY